MSERQIKRNTDAIIQVNGRAWRIEQRLSELESRLTDAEKLNANLHLRVIDLEKQVEQHKKRWRE